MTQADRIRRVAEKHAELRVPCERCDGLGSYIFEVTRDKQGNELSRKALEPHCHHCAGTGWTPLDVRDWADALWKAGWYVQISWYMTDGTSRGRIVKVECDNETFTGWHAEADNAEDALVLALEQAS